MVRTRYEIPALIHGVSQLPAPARAPAHAESDTNMWPIVEEGLQKRPPLIHVAKVHTGSFGSSAFTSKIDRGTGEQYLTIAKFFDSTLGGTPGAGAMKIFDLSGNTWMIQDNLIHTNVSQFAYLGLTAADVTAGYLTKSQENIRQVSTFKNTYIANRRQSPTMSGIVSSPQRPKGHAYIFIRIPNYGVKYTVTLSIAGIDLGSGVGTERTVYVSTPGAVGTPYGSASPNDEGYQCWDFNLLDYPGGTGNFAQCASCKTQDIAELFRLKLTGTGPVGVYNGNSRFGTQMTAGLLTVTRVGSVLKIVTAGAAAGLDFATMKVTSSAGDSYAYAIWNEIDSSNELPKFCTHDYVVKVKGAVSGPEDDYYLKFNADAGSGFGRGVWEECVRSANPGSSYAIAMSPVTTPHKLTRQTDATGAVTGVAGTRYFTFDPVDWDYMIAGDEESNPVPICVDTSRHIQDIVSHKGRLFWLYEDGVLASEQGEELNYHRTTVRALPDTDPIDSQFSTDEVGVLHSAVPLAGELMLFSKSSQLAFRGRPILTPSTVEAPRVARNGSTDTARPVAFEKGAIFGVDLGTYSGLKYLVPSDNVEDVHEAINLTLHISSMILAPLRQIEVSTDNSTIAVLGAATSKIYILKQHKEGDKIIQSAWVTFDLEDANILGVHFFGTRLYVISQRTEGVFLEYLELSPGIYDEGRNYWLHLDRRVSNTTAGVSIAWGGVTTTVTMPYDLETNAVMELVTTANSTRYIGTKTGARTFTVAVNLTGLAFVAGKYYGSTHYFHKPQVMLDARNGEALVLDSASSVISLSLRYENTSYLQLYVGSDVTSIGNATVGFQGTTSPLTGDITAGIMQRLELPWSVYISNPTPFPHSLVSAEWLLNAVIRSGSI